MKGKSKVSPGDFVFKYFPKNWKNLCICLNLSETLEKQWYLSDGAYAYHLLGFAQLEQNEGSEEESNPQIQIAISVSFIT